MTYPRPGPATLHGWALTLVALLLAVLVGACSNGGTAPEAPAASSTATTEVSTAALPFAAEPPAEWNGAIVAVDELPPEALDTLMLIADGGPYPYGQDGSTFQNREGILPGRSSGFYSEYTVETPGSSDRGARRLVVGDDTASYYTDDHYDSFRFVAP